MTLPVDSRIPAVIALVSELRQMQCEPASFGPHSVAGAAERAADEIERLRLSLTTHDAWKAEWEAQGAELRRLRTALTEAQRWEKQCAPLLEYLTGSAALCDRPVDYAKELRAALTAAEKLAARWRHARQFLAVEDIERWSSEDWIGHYPNEDESVRADEAIDRAIQEFGNE